MPLTQVEPDVAKAQIRQARAIEEISNTLGSILKQLIIQNENLQKLAESKEASGTWYMSKPMK